MRHSSPSRSTSGSRATRRASRPSFGSTIRRPLRTRLGRAATTTRPWVATRFDQAGQRTRPSARRSRRRRRRAAARPRCGPGASRRCPSTSSGGTAARPVASGRGERAGATTIGSTSASAAHAASAASSVERPDRGGPVTRAASCGPSCSNAGSSVRTLIPIGRLHLSAPISAPRRRLARDTTSGSRPMGAGRPATASPSAACAERGRGPPASRGRGGTTSRARPRAPADGRGRTPSAGPLDGVGEVEHQPLAGGGGQRLAAAHPRGRRRAPRGFRPRRLLPAPDGSRRRGDGRPRR